MGQLCRARERCQPTAAQVTTRDSSDVDLTAEEERSTAATGQISPLLTWRAPGPSLGQTVPPAKLDAQVHADAEEEDEEGRECEYDRRVEA